MTCVGALDLLRGPLAYTGRNGSKAVEVGSQPHLDCRRSFLREDLVGYTLPSWLQCLVLEEVPVSAPYPSVRLCSCMTDLPKIIS